VSSEADVVILGAGVSGLVAAKTLVEQRPGLRVQVLEQRGRVGGRTVNLDVPGHPGVIMEGGGTWLGPTQDHALNLSRELGLELYHTHYNYPGMNRNTSEPQVFPTPSVETLQVIDEIELLAAEFGTEAPWAHPKAAEYDALTLGDWLRRRQVSERIMQELSDAVAIPLGADSLDDFSFLFYLFFSASCPFRYDVGLYGGAQDFRLVRGSQALSLELLSLVRSLGVEVRLGTTVRHVSIAEDGVSFATDAGEILGQHGIIALGTGDAARLSYTGLPEQREFLHASWIRNEGGKFFFVFDHAFWRDEGLFGAPQVPVLGGLFFDYTPFNRTEPGIIAGFLDNKTFGTSQAERRAALEVLMTSALGLRTPFHVESYVEEWWDLKHEGGTANIVQYLGKGVLSNAGAAWRAPVHRLHWAGSDTAEKWMGYIDGAVSSGKRAAAEVLSGSRAPVELV
jgi:monoamine oxidase